MLRDIHVAKLEAKRKCFFDYPIPTIRPFVYVPDETTVNIPSSTEPVIKPVKEVIAVDENIVEKEQEVAINKSLPISVNKGLSISVNEGLPIKEDYTGNKDTCLEKETTVNKDTPLEKETTANEEKDATANEDTQENPAERITLDPIPAIMDTDMDDPIDYYDYEEENRLAQEEEQNEEQHLEPIPAILNMEETRLEQEEGRESPALDSIPAIMDTDMDDPIDYYDHEEENRLAQEVEKNEEQHIDPLDNFNEDEVLQKMEILKKRLRVSNKLKVINLATLQMEALDGITRECARKVGLTQDPFGRSIIQDFYSKLSGSYQNQLQGYQSHVKALSMLEKIKRAKKKNDEMTFKTENNRERVQRQIESCKKEIQALDEQTQTADELDDYFDSVMKLF